MTAPIATDTSIATFSKTILKDNIADHHIAAGDLEDTRRLASGNRHRIPTVNHDVFVNRYWRSKGDGERISKGDDFTSLGICDSLTKRSSAFIAIVSHLCRPELARRS